MAAGLRRSPRRHPRLAEAVVADARITAAMRGERYEFRSRLDTCVQAVRLVVVSDAFLGQVLYRAKARSMALGVPLLPRLLHRMAIASAGIYIGDEVIVWPGVYLVHGQVVVEGRVEIRAGVVISPTVTIAQGRADRGPTIGPGVSLGAGSRVLGAVAVGARARIGANAVVLADVPEEATAVGVPARISTVPADVDGSAGPALRPRP